jgi:ribosomal protein S17E
MLDKLVQVLPLHLKDGIDFYYTKNNILFFVLTHQLYKNEFKHNKQLIKSLLNQLNLKYINDIEYFVTNKPKIIKKVKIKPITTIPYKRKSYAIFDNNAKNAKIHQKFEEIRILIKNKI